MDDYAVTKEVAETREEKTDKYKEFILECLSKYPDMSAVQIWNWIQKRTNLENLELQERAF